MANLAKKSLVVDPGPLRELTRLGRFRTESEAVRDAITRALAIRQMREAIAGIQRRGSFGRHLK
jgi:Arc/MetJ-type ribon-helix-helix transcriptional regulator